jgi:OOP family OmpA-OmpF porin
MKYVSLKNRNKYLILLFHFLSTSVLCQNLIPNPSFEVPVNFENIRNQNEWHKYFAHDSPDYFNFSSEFESYNIFDNYFGGTMPADGQAFMGIFCYRVNQRKKINNIREFVETPLTETLIKDSVYDLSIDICLDKESNVAIKNFGVLFTLKPSEFNKDYKLFKTEPQILFDSTFLDNSDEWIKLKTQYIAEGYENFLIIGNFNSDKNTEVMPLHIPGDNNKKKKWNLEKNELAAYYYIDNLKLNKIQRTPEDIQRNKTDVFFDIAEKNIDSVIILSNIYFEFNSSVLLDSSFYELNRLVNLLEKNSNIRLLIVGHTDNIGTEEYNLQLSLQRALSVRKYLVNNGISPGRLEYEGKGFSIPLKNNETEENRQINRRVEFKILNK